MLFKIIYAFSNAFYPALVVVSNIDYRVTAGSHTVFTMTLLMHSLRMISDNIAESRRADLSMKVEP